jgi:hypothetical protein
MSRWLWACAFLLLSPLPSAAQQGDTPARALAPHEIRVALEASRTVFAAQAAERREAESLGLTDLEGELRSLHQVILDGAGPGRPVRPLLDASDGDPAAPSGEFAQNLANMQRKLDDIQVRTRSIEAKIGWAKSPRQRAIARAATARLNALRAEAEAALGEPEQVREQLLGELATRLTVTRVDPMKNAAPEPPPPTLSLAPDRPVFSSGKPRQVQGK